VIEQHGELRGRQRHRVARLGQSRPEEVSAVDAFGEQAEPRAIPKQDLQERGFLAAEDEQMAGEWILLKMLLDQRRKSVETLAVMWCTT